MTLKPQLTLTQRQTLALTPAMRMSLGILRKPTADLGADIVREIEENPFLTLSEGRSTGDAYAFAMETAFAQTTPIEALFRQIGTMRLEGGVQAAAALLLSELREDGYLDATLEEIADERDVPVDWLLAGLEAVQRCDPPGVGARDLAECLALKLIDAGTARDLAHAATAELEAFAEGNWPRLTRKLGLAQPELERLARVLRSLSPVPIDPDEAPPATRIPEICVDAGQDGTLIARLNPDALPQVSIAPGMGAAGAVSDELDALRLRARSLIDALRMRGTTLLAIGRHLVHQQSAFFLDGHARILPETRAEAAATLGIHPSTLGRAISGKSLVAGGKVVPLETFFSRALAQGDGVVSAFDVQRRMGTLIGAETGEVALSDDAIATILNKEGIDIARRTVAKYRKCMRIPSSFERRRRMAPQWDRS